ncbi:HipA domain-containing protein (plasmid) [Methylomarinum sp. Ch1-1]|uniref:HipA domain-containing protein n=1 Tax=Methylomarinum roseum TaxID=3067653 RepID=A0AAU7P0G7_9GAMM|nr:HipA domain-containing protein [Methylomarinum sp. Ch1-1]MDP4523194.1 HipA domain-containing protein [Methylomarinum sp. Ch1-1]
MGSIQQETRFIAVDIFLGHNQGNPGYETAGYILLNNLVSGFVYSAHYDGPSLDPVHLIKGVQKSFKPPHHHTLHGVFRDTLPGHWGSKQLVEEYPGYAQMSDIERMFWLGSRTSKGLRFRCYKKPGVESPVRGIEILREIERKSIDFLMGRHNRGQPIYDEQTKWAVIEGGGSRPKAQFQLKGIDMMAKFNAPFDPYNMAKMEHVTLGISRSAGIETPRSWVLPASENGEDIFLIERFDRSKQLRHHTISLATLVGVDNANKTNMSSVDYLDIADAIRQASDHPEEDVEELYARMILVGICNITDNHLRNLEIILNKDGKYRLSPNFDLVPDPWNSPFDTHLCNYTRADQHNFMTGAFVVQTAEKLGISFDRAKTIATRVAQAAIDSEPLMDKANLNEKDKALFKKIIDPDRLKSMVHELEAMQSMNVSNQENDIRLG